MNMGRLWLLAAGFAATLYTLPARAADEDPAAKALRVERARIDRIPAADLGNGRYRNPVLVGPGTDNSVISGGQRLFGL